jgi:hypothetical protein
VIRRHRPSVGQIDWPLLSELIVKAMSSNADETMLPLETPTPVSVTTPPAAAATTPPTAPPATLATATPATDTPATDTDTTTTTTANNGDVPAVSAPSAVTGADAENAIDVDNKPLSKNTFAKVKSDRESEWNSVFLDRYEPKKGGKAYDHPFLSSACIRRCREFYWLYLFDISCYC